jgi:dTDP-4-amino-4,6-dideoxygalactose transaminase
MIHYFIPDMPTTDQLTPYLREIDHNRWYSNFGPLFDKLKLSLAEKILNDIDPNRIVLVSSGTSAIELALKNLQLPTGSKILTSSFTFPATIEAILNVGLTPVICDIDKENWQLTPAIAEQAIFAQDFSAVVPVAAFGIPVCSENWSDFSNRTGLPVVVDAAAALINQEISDTLIYAFSLHTTKPIGAGEGGLVVCPSKGQALQIQKMSNFGIEPDRIINQVGTNAKLSEYHCAVGLANMQRLTDTLSKRNQLFKYYTSLLTKRKLPLCLQAGSEQYTPTSLYVVFDDASADSVSSALFERNIETRRLYSPIINAHPAFENIDVLDNSELVNALTISENGLALPFHMHLSHEEIEVIVNALAEVLVS